MLREKLKYVAAVLLYGTVGTFLRFVALPSEMVAFFRGLIGAVFILLVLLVRGKRPDGAAIRRNGRWLLLSGVCLGLNWLFLFAAYVETSVAVASLCNYLAPVLVIAAAPLLLRERLDKRKLPLILLALIGIVLVSGVLGGGGGSLKGVLLGLAAAVCFAAIVLCNRRLRDISPMDRSLVQLALSAATLLPFVLVKSWGHWPAPDLGSVLIVLLLGAVHTGFAYCLYFSGMSSLPVQTVALLGYLEPVVSVLCSAFFLAEPLTLLGWVGAALILGAAAAGELLPEKK